MSLPEERISALEAHRSNDQTVLQGVSDKLDTVAADVQAIKLGLEGQKGFLKGMLAVLLPIWTLITIGVGYAWDWWQSGNQQ